MATLALPRSVKRLMRLWWRMLANTGSTVAMRRLYRARPVDESMALAHAVVGNQRGDVALVQRLDVVVAEVARVGGDQGLRFAQRGLLDHRQQHGLLGSPSR